MIKGSIVALVTPFNYDYSVNFDKLGELIEFHIEQKTDAILVLGTTGESSVLTFDEEEDIVKYTIKKAAGRIPIIVGSGSNDTAIAIWQSQRFEKMGADGLLVITPYYNKTNEEGMYKHFEMVANSVKCPIILYNVPGRTGCGISINVLKRLSKFDNIVGIKEASGNMSYVMKVAKLIDDNFSLWSGNDDIILPLLSVGGSGVISVVANIMPNAIHEMVHTYLNGDVKGANKKQLEYLDIIDSMFYEVNPIPVKEALNHLGFEAGPCRMPLFDMDKTLAKKMYNLIDNSDVVYKWQK
ncbi:MAG: 4-hydroxy-tetrahydrodipicolinate synthase [Bacillota bacterium]|mgnify:CR=1 FL=1|jgi:4-hydroxy-tetrahydrodipicolinate synthase|nr:4-hydroxy-tetrahydrodipicolinate synthase [Bacillota bacterium]NLP21548.1 4-hydroxy-tetrahydrodipicolinate synthase [Erysipelotrichaceae bacterium]